MQAVGLSNDTLSGIFRIVWGVNYHVPNTHFAPFLVAVWLQYAVLGTWWIAPQRLLRAVSATPKQLFAHSILPCYCCEISLQKINTFSSVFQKCRFCIAKQPLSPCKTYAFAMPNNRFWNAKV